MESISSTIKLLFPRCVMAGIDLKDAYYHLPIHAEHQQYLRVAVILEGQELGWIINFEKSRLNPDTTQMFLGIQLDSIQGADVRVFSDNSTTVAYVNRQGGTRSGSLMTIAGEIFQFAETHLASLSALHIRGIENTKADYLSRNRLRQGEWSLNRTVFRLITRAWGVPQIDLFATRGNRQVERFASLNSMDHPDISITSGKGSLRLIKHIQDKHNANPEVLSFTGIEKVNFRPQGGNHDKALLRQEARWILKSNAQGPLRLNDRIDLVIGPIKEMTCS
ncbi:uncharacterized protein LOC143788831 [Ranitomeya variabilis]|uniref:uncharacterized protein LOC143788831 n=1 Tax=Ranitomeya variabilis TaxID=490064 RepID=UPI0040574413